MNIWSMHQNTDKKNEKVMEEVKIGETIYFKWNGEVRKLEVYMIVTCDNVLGAIKTRCGKILFERNWFKNIEDVK